MLNNRAIYNYIFLFVAIFAFSCSDKSELTGSILLHNGKIWTGDDENPWASWILIEGEHIAAIGREDTPLPAAGETVDLSAQLTLPGFNDSHVHFESAGSLLLGINLLDVNDEENLVKRMKETLDRLPKGSWITGGDWGAYEAWGMGSDGSRGDKTLFTPHRNMIDDFTAEYPVLINRYDRTEGLANKVALEYLGIESKSGILEGEQLLEALKKIPEKSFERRLAESKRALEECRKWGVSTVQDMSSWEQLEVYRELFRRGELSCRINYCPSRLVDYTRMIEEGWVIHAADSENSRLAGDDWIAFGTIKTHIDGIMGARTALFYEAYSDNIPENRNWKGGWREFSSDLGSFKKMIISADSAGIQLRIHAIGDRANSLLLDIVDTLEQVNGVRDRRFRLVHAQVIAPEDFPRFNNRQLVAEVQPYHVTDDMRWMEERIGYERCKGAYAFRTLMDNGCILSFGSDWPGTNASYYPINPLLGLYAAVTRQTLNGSPEEGWFPEQKLDLETALRAYTYGSAFGAYEESKKGKIRVGMLADIAVLNTNLFESKPSDWLNAKVVYTLVGGKIIYRDTDAIR